MVSSAATLWATQGISSRILTNFRYPIRVKESWWESGQKSGIAYLWVCGLSTTGLLKKSAVREAGFFGRNQAKEWSLAKA